MLNETYDFVPFATIFDALDSSVQEARARMIEDWQLQDKERFKCFEVIEKLFAAVAQFPIKFDSLTAYPWGKAITLFYTEKVDKWSDVLPCLEAIGEMANTDNFRNHDVPETYTRVYSCNVEFCKDSEGNSDIGTIHLYVSLPGDTETCRRVVVGVEEVTKPALKYAFECKGE